MHNLLHILRTMIHPDTEVHLMCEVPIAERMKEIKSGLGDKQYDEFLQMKLRHLVGDAAVMRHLKQEVRDPDTDSGQLAHLEAAKYTAAIIVAEAEMDTDVVQADAHSLATLLAVKKRRLEQLKAFSRTRASSLAPACAARTHTHPHSRRLLAHACFLSACVVGFFLFRYCFRCFLHVPISWR